MNGPMYIKITVQLVHRYVLKKKKYSNNKAFQTAGTNPVPSANTNPYALICLVTRNSAKVWEADSSYCTEVSVFTITECTSNLSQYSTHPRERCQKMNLKLSVDSGSVSSSWDAAMCILTGRIRRWFRGCKAYQSLTYTEHDPCNFPDSLSSFRIVSSRRDA